MHVKNNSQNCKTTTKSKNNDATVNTEQLSDYGVVISNATAKWKDNQTDSSLENIKLTVRPGRLVAIIGPVGAGKVNLIFFYELV